MKLRVKCREATLLASRAMDNRLPFFERTVLKLHLAVCGNCARFARQLGVMRRLMQDAPPPAVNDSAHGLSHDARERIGKALHKMP